MKQYFEIIGLILLLKVIGYNADDIVSIVFVACIGWIIFDHVFDNIIKKKKG